MFIWRTRLAQLQNRLCMLISRCDNPDLRRHALREVEQRLAKWREDMPVEWRPGQDLICGSGSSLMTALLHLSYFSVARTLYWSFMVCGAAQESKPHKIQTVRQAFDPGREFLLCLGSSRAFVRTLNSVMVDVGERRLFYYLVCFFTEIYRFRVF
ncbi:hypothetical protein EJ08DRAFT_260308 [Tothia fuscella]|uniref:Uncharacterized protein n=1 Tax=Tothia fuscella TaxID=1048955 RepID=A0A9P4NRN8_9PEZI|nr:hypothetical protein EJ08DRAFT_260308 [Tothia fuscella]